MHRDKGGRPGESCLTAGEEHGRGCRSPSPFGQVQGGQAGWCAPFPVREPFAGGGPELRGHHNLDATANPLWHPLLEHPTPALGATLGEQHQKSKAGAPERQLLAEGGGRVR